MDMMTEKQHLIAAGMTPEEADDVLQNIEQQQAAEASAMAGIAAVYAAYITTRGRDVASV